MTVEEVRLFVYLFRFLSWILFLCCATTDEESLPFLLSLSLFSDAQPSPKQKTLESRITALEQDKEFAATQTAVQQVQAACLQQLREVRAALDKQQPAGGGASSAAAELKAAAAEKQALQKKIAKLEYRLQHVLESMEMLYEKAQSAAPAV